MAGKLESVFFNNGSQTFSDRTPTKRLWIRQIAFSINDGNLWRRSLQIDSMSILMRSKSLSFTGQV